MDRTPPREQVAAWLSGHPFVVDATLAGLAAVLLVGLPAGPDQLPELVIGLALVVPLAWRRLAPLPAAVLVIAAGLLELVVIDAFLPANVAAPVMVYALAAYAPRWAGRWGLVVGLIGAALAAVRYYGLANGESIVLSGGAIAVTVVAAWALGNLRRARLNQFLALEERARLLELERAQELRLAATSERTRIAREMHDVVAHSLSVVIAQADGGLYAGREDPSAATGALQAIAATGRQALGDMRGLLGVLREDGSSDYAPQPDVAAIGALVADVRASGHHVDLVVEGTPRRLGAGPELAAYRIVQESLTNVLKHAGPVSRAWVRLQWRTDALEIAVLDDGRGASAALVEPGAAQPDPGTGHGLLGMRERAGLYGGRLDAGPRHGGGYGVHALIPNGRPR